MKLNAPTISTTEINRTTNSGPCVVSVPALAGIDFLAASAPAMARTGILHQEAADQHGQARRVTL